jgi:hypothetical protein
VQSALGGLPTSVVRFASRGLVTELWVYRDHGISIRFDRTADGKREATEISELSALAAE